MSDDNEKWAAKRLDGLIDLHFGPSQQGKDRVMEWDATLPPPDIKDWKGVAVVSEPRRGGKSYWRKRAEDAEGRLGVVREWIDRRGVNVGDRDDDYMRGYRDAQRHALQDAAELRAAIEDAR